MENKMFLILLVLALSVALLLLWRMRYRTQEANTHDVHSEDGSADPDGRIQYYELVIEGHTAFRQGDFQATLDLCSEAIEIQPSWGLAYYLRGQTYHQMGDFDAAVTAYQAAIKQGLPDALKTKAAERLWLARSLSRTDL